MSASPTPSLVSKYRPTSFQDFYGQEHPVAYLRGLIRRKQVGRNLLLHGSIGSGKTSLARVYARALNCEAPTDDGSPCGACERCAQPARQAGIHEYDVPGKGGTKTLIEEFTDQHCSPQPVGEWSILFFDEAHQITDEAANFLLKSVEEPPPGVVFIFATTEVNRILSALRSRLFPLQVKPLPIDTGIAFLKDFAAREGIAYDPEALQFLAGLKRGYPRDLLMGLDQVTDAFRGKLTIQRVREVFDFDQTDHLVRYFTALAGGDRAGQIEVLLAWREPPIAKARWVQAFLTALYYNDVLGCSALVDPAVQSIPRGERAAILDRFCARLALTDRADLRPAWRALMALWDEAPHDEEDAAVMLRFALFHDLVNDGLTDAPLRSGRVEAVVTPSKDRPVLAPSARGNAGEDPAFLREADARLILNRASFLAQEYGAWFDAWFEVRPALLGAGDEAGALSLIADFVDDLEQAVDRGGHRPFAAITLHARDDSDVFGRILAHLPRGALGGTEDGGAAIATWCQAWRSRRIPGAGGIAFEPAPRRAPARAFHWRKARLLCAGLDRATLALDPTRGEDKPLHALLGVTPQELGPIRAAPLVRLSRLLCAREVARACRNGMKPLSAYDAGAWDALGSGWEVEEHAHRLDERERRDTEVRAIAARYGAATPEHCDALRDARARWRAGPSPRPGRGWFRRGEA